MFRAFYKLYLMLFVSAAISAMIVVPIMQYMFVTRAGTTTDDDIRGVIYVFRERLVAFPTSQWTGTIAKMRAPFPLFTFDLVPRSALRLTTAENATLDHGYSMQQKHGEVVIDMPQSGFVLRMTGSRFSFITNLYNVLAWSTVSLVLSMGIFIWLRSHWIDLGKLSTAAERFGKGRLDGRAGLPDRSSVAALAKRFDSMADRIQMLVSNQNDMINAISHELRTPITRFGFSLALLQTSQTKPQMQRHIDALLHDVDELDELVRELLSYGALEQSDRLPDRQPVRLGELLDSVVGSLALEMESLDVQCSVQVGAPSATVVIDSRLTARALINLTKNAMRYCRTQVALAARVDRDVLVVHVDDDGIGIPAADREAIFEPFHRLDRSRDRSTGGFGLGLAIVKRAVESQGGAVHVLDSPLGGARFEIELPLTDDPGDHTSELGPVREK